LFLAQEKFQFILKVSFLNFINATDLELFLVKLGFSYSSKIGKIGTSKNWKPFLSKSSP